jgi:hypothetical protein
MALHLMRYVLARSIWSVPTCRILGLRVTVFDKIKNVIRVRHKHWLYFHRFLGIIEVIHLLICTLWTHSIWSQTFLPVNQWNLDLSSQVAIVDLFVPLDGVKSISYIFSPRKLEFAILNSLRVPIWGEPYFTNLNTSTHLLSIQISRF